MPAPRILVVEDETIVAMDIERGLRELGYEVVASVGTGAGALGLAEMLRPDLVLMDIRLQGDMDGIEAGRKIRRGFGIPLIFLTAYADESTVNRAKAAEPFGYLLKPFEDQELHTAIEIALHKRRVEEMALQRADEALRQSKERFDLLVENLKDYAVFLLDTRGHMVTWNPGAQRITGYSEGEILGRHLSVFYRPQEIIRNMPDQLLWIATQEGQVRDAGWRLRKDTSPFWADVMITALRDKQGQMVGFASITRDITEQRKAEEEIRQLNATLEQRVQERTAELHATNQELNAANRELEAFTYSVAHDLRAPLRGLLGYLSILREQIGQHLSSEAGEFLGKGQDCAERMSHLVDDLLKLSRVGRQALQCQPVSLQQLAKEVRSELAAETQGRTVNWQIDPLPTANCDPGLMKQVFVNLLGNALKYSGSQEVPFIHVGQTQNRGETVFFVRDNGVGFDMKYAHKLFQPFTRLHAEQQFQGTGVGLAVVERIITRHGGRVWAQGEPGKGATVFFTLGEGCLPFSTSERLDFDAIAGISNLTPR